MNKPIFENEEEAREFLEILNSKNMNINNRINCMDIFRSEGYIKKDIVQEVREKYSEWMKTLSSISWVGSTVYGVPKDSYEELISLIKLQHKAIEQLTNK